MEASIAQQYADLSGRISQDQLMDPRAQVPLLLRSAKTGNGQRDERAADTLQPTGLATSTRGCRSSHHER